MKVRYRSRQMEHAVDQPDVGVMNIYKTDILQHMRWLSTIWKEIVNDVIRNCWRTNGIVPAYYCFRNVAEVAI